MKTMWKRYGLFALLSLLLIAVDQWSKALAYDTLRVDGPIALIKEGDIITIDIPNNAISVDVSDEELARRRAQWQPRQPRVTTGYLSRYAKQVSSGMKGAVLS